VAALVPILINRAGADLTAGLVSAGASGDTFPAGMQFMLRVKNGNASPTVVTVTPVAGGAAAGETVAPHALGTVAASTGDRMFGPFPANPYADSNGNVNVSYSVQATVTVAVYQLSTS
jgi:hypothetical protein